MCLPVTFLKSVVKFNAFASILVGVGSIATGIFVSVKIQQSNLFELSDQYNSSTFLNCLFIFGGVTIFIGIMGLFGGYRKKTCLLAFYNLGNIALMFTFLILAIEMLKKSQDFADLSYDQCGNNEWSQQIEVTSLGANQYFCQDECSCYINLNRFPNGYIQNLSNPIVFHDEDHQGQNIVQFKQCPSYFTSLPSNITDPFNYNILNAAEDLFGCTGWCSFAQIYRFSNINRGPPKNTNQTCFFAVINFVHQYGDSLGAICLTTSFIFFMILAFTCCLIFHPEKRGEPNLYKRMAYFDDSY